MSSINLATQFNIGMYVLNGENHYWRFSESTDIIQVLNELPTNERHIKVPQDRLLCPTHIDNKKKRFLKKKI